MPSDGFLLLIDEGYCIINQNEIFLRDIAIFDLRRDGMRAESPDHEFGERRAAAHCEYLVFAGTCRIA